MNESQKKALSAIHAAIIACGAAVATLISDEQQEPVKPAPKPKKEAPAAAAPEPAKPAPEAAKPPPAAASNGAGDNIETQTRKAAKAYAEVYGREGLKEVLGKFTTGTLADVPADKLPELLKALS